MSVLRTHKILAVGITLVLLMAACGPSPAQDSAISTAVAQTVQAQNTLETLSVPTSASPALTDTPPALTPLAATAAGTPSTQVAVEFCTASALLTGETYPDGTIVQPGTTFTKVWKITNNGTCVWDSTWQLIFYNGDLMDGAYVYKFPQPAEPGQTVDVPVILKAPAQNGTYTGEWMLKSPWGKVFGVGQYSSPISVSIVVGSGVPENKKTETVFGVTAVSYTVDRRCAPANTFYTITVYITTNGPIEVTFTTIQSDGHVERNRLLKFTEATTKSYSWEWSQVKGSSPNPRWARITVNEPTYQEFGEVVLPDLCYFKP